MVHVELEPQLVTRAVFLSALPTDSTPDAAQVNRAVRDVAATLGDPGQWAAAVAFDYGEYPESAARRMRWAQRAASAAVRAENVRSAGGTGAMVVLDGSERLIWRRTERNTWLLVGLWPSAGEAAEIASAVDRGVALLVVLDRQSTIHAMADELTDAPPSIAALVRGTDNDIVELTVPQLDWLSPPLRRRGRRFLRAADRRLRTTPALLRPPLVVETPPAAPANVRFALRAHPFARQAGDFTTVTERLFTTPSHRGRRDRSLP